ncbi:MAG: PD-(D/E)XK nuclease family protein [Candidatus Pacebacteria bacterium]|nr:PD-(D/E)XK nuclease family protein [Candidatus Paceibacterota bacterium]
MQEKIYTKRGNYTSGQKEPYRISRSKIDLFLNCPRCFYLDRKLGIPQPPGFPFTLNTAVDTLLKKEFDIHRAKQTAHPFIEKYGLDNVVPYQNELMDEWRNALSGGICYLHQSTNFYITGGVDDVWENTKTKELIIVDYKATSKDGEVNLDADWQIGYKRQMEVYQWLFRQNGFKVSDIGYFVYCNGITDKQAFDGKLEFDVKLLPYKGNPSWIEQTLFDIKACLESETIPESSFNCPYCNYRKAVRILKLEI